MVLCVDGLLLYNLKSNANNPSPKVSSLVPKLGIALHSYAN